MAAGKSQGKSFSVFLIGLVVACVGLANAIAGMSMLALLIGIVLIAASFAWFFKIKPHEGKPALGSQPTGQKLLGLLLAVGGWLIVLGGLHLTSGTSGRMAIAIVGILVSLSGILYVLPAACNKNAIWKS